MDTRNAWSIFLTADLHSALLDDPLLYLTLHTEYSILVQGLFAALPASPSRNTTSAFKHAARAKALECIRAGGAGVPAYLNVTEAADAALELLRKMTEKSDSGQANNEPFVAIAHDQCRK
jgi:hypothetical protein